MSSITNFKVILLGDAGVGKSSIIHRYIMSEFLEKSSATLGSCFVSKTLMKDGEMIKLSVSFRSLISRFGTLPGKRSTEA